MLMPQGRAALALATNKAEQPIDVRFAAKRIMTQKYVSDKYEYIGLNLVRDGSDLWCTRTVS